MSDVGFDRVAVGDDYATTDASCDDERQTFVAATLTVTGAAIYYQIADRPNHWSAEKLLPPAVGVLPLPACHGLRMRNAVTGRVAVATVDMITQETAAAAGGIGALSAPPYSLTSDGNLVPAIVGTGASATTGTFNPTGVTDLIDIPAGSTFVVALIAITGTCIGDASGGGSTAAYVQATAGLDGAGGGAADLAFFDVIYPASTLVNAPPVTIPGPIPVYGGDGGNTLQADVVQYGTPPPAGDYGGHVSLLGAFT